MAEVLSPHMPPPSPSPNDSSDSIPSIAQPPQAQPRPQARERVPSYAQSRMSQYSKSSQRSRPQSTATSDYPAFTSSLPYAQVRDFAYPPFHPLHYGAQPESSGASTPTSEFHPGRRSSDPENLQQFSNSSSSSGWSAGPWGGDGVMYGDPEHEDGIAALPSTSFGSSDETADFDNDLTLGRNKHRKSKSYADITDFERGRRRESGGAAAARRSKDFADPHLLYYPNQASDPAGRERLRQSRGYSNSGTAEGPRRDSRFASNANATSTLPNRSFHHSQPPATSSDESEDLDPIPLDTEPNTSTHSPLRSSMGPEDEELFAGPSLALYAFEPENSNELRLVEGQEIMVSYRHGQGWLVASDPRTGEQGLVPEAYVRLIADMPNYDPEIGGFVDVEEGEGEGETEDETGEVAEDERAEERGPADAKTLEADEASDKKAEGVGGAP
ncbi:HOG (high osmolarity glycerol) pathway protein [Saxophila tyrrhenica]|uniref:HOG (High osmolarity glycerol) pathway protein n=1 Tax=Saxophila tyrrhenica TaxID=1690608 RepID=A0AAV9P322_9PEZI|nr:HOG (high osmolarity glycerol) pathway protein [Saxophila tyrrhenica]